MDTRGVVCLPREMNFVKTAHVKHNRSRNWKLGVYNT